MGRIIRKLLPVLMLLSCTAWADVTDLRPNADVTTNWTINGSGTGDCGASSQWGCLNSDVEIPEDSTGLIADGTDAAQASHGLQNSPGDYSTTISATAKVRIRCEASCTADDNDFVQLAATTSGGTDTFTIAVNGTPTCDLPSSSTFVNCSFTLTTGFWDTSAEINGATFTLTYTNSSVSMPDTIQYNVSEFEILLSYTAAGLDSTVIQVILIQ